MKKKLNTISLFSFLFLLLCSANTFSQSALYKASGKVIIGGETRWDYLAVEEASGRLFVSHASKVNVIDLASGTPIGEISELSGVHGIAFAPEYNKGFISNRDGQITVFELSTLKKTGSIKIDGKNPDAIIYDSFSKRIFTMNHSSNSVTAIDPQTEKVIGTFALQGVPEFAASDNNGKIYVNLEDKNAVNVFAAKELKVLAFWPITPAEGPSGMAIDREHKRLFCVGDNKLMAVLDINTGKVISTVPIGSGVDACAYDTNTNLVFSSNGEGTLTVIKEETPDTYKVLETVPTIKGARTMTLDEKTHNVYCTAAFDTGKKGTDGKPVRDFGVLILNYNK